MVEAFVALVFIIGAYQLGAEGRPEPKQMTAQDCAIMCVEVQTYDELRRTCKCQKSLIKEW